MLDELRSRRADDLNLTHNVVKRDVAAFSRALEDQDISGAERDAIASLFSNEAFFLSERDFTAMKALVKAVEDVVSLPGYRPDVKTEIEKAGLSLPVSSGAFMGFDFHLTEDGPRLIEVNTNAGGAFLNSFFRQTLSACCDDMAYLLRTSPFPDFDHFVFGMIDREWNNAGRTGRPSTIAIVDEVPGEQFLFPEFLLAQRYFERRGMTVIIADPSELEYRSGGVCYDGVRVDFVYNRLTDFQLSEPTQAGLLNSWKAGTIVMSPSPAHHRLYANKTNLIFLSDADYLRKAGASDQMISSLGLVPETESVTAGNADRLWRDRKSYFFKPTEGFGSRAVYRGDKLTTKSWGHIVAGGYIAQSLAMPCSRSVMVGEGEVQQKVDLRLYSYAGEVFLAAARLYQGQTTNFRTPGGGFAPVFIV